MALPTVTKTWTISPNNTRVWNGDIWDRRTIWIWIKNWLKSVGWTVRSSCNASTAYNDGTDSWVSASNINYHYNGSYNKSWIVLRAPSSFSSGGTWDLMFSCGSPNGSNWSGQSGTMRITSNITGYNLNGTTQAWPTVVSGSEHTHLYWGSSYTYAAGMALGRSDDTGYSWRVHYMSNAEGTNFRVFVCTQGYCIFMMLFERLDNVEAPAVWTDPCVLGVGAIGNSWQNVNTVSNNYMPFSAGGFQSYTGWSQGWPKCGHFKGWIAGQQVSLYTTCEYIVSDSLCVQWGVRNEITNNQPLYPLGLAAGDVGKRGRAGVLTDIWGGQGDGWAVTDRAARWGVLDGETYPSDGSRKLVQFGNLIVPWTGSEASPTSVPCYVA